MITPKAMHRSKMVVAAGAAFLLWGLLLALALDPAHAAGSCTTTAGTTTCTFSPTGAEDAFVVPDGVSSVHVVATGAPGAVGLDGRTAGRGARVIGNLTVDPGQTLYVNVGGAPTGTTTGCYPTSDCIGGFNGGGNSYYGGGGGGASDVREISRAEDGSLGSRLIVAGGGGGSGLGWSCAPSPSGGAGGDAESPGGDGSMCYGVSGGTGGGAGGQSAGGLGGSPDGGDGSLGLGGNGDDHGGGGGGGLYGGGSGGRLRVVEEGLVPAGGGGGGSNLVPTGGTAGVADSGPSITISYTLTPVNEAPSVTVDRGGRCGPASDMRGTINLAFSDPDTPAQDLTLTATSSNTAVVPSGAVSFGGGTDASRTMTVGRLTGTGTSALTVTVSDGDREGSVVVRVVSGSAANDALTGTANADIIFARKGADTLGGRGANDLLCAGNGKDALTGGAGADHFSGGYGTTDTATDFDAAQGDTKRGVENF